MSGKNVYQKEIELLDLKRKKELPDNGNGTSDF